ncbi:hypothetical protein D9M70_632410 [compost metagenome]
MQFAPRQRVYAKSLIGILNTEMVSRPTVVAIGRHQTLELKIAPRLQPYLAAGGNPVARLVRRTLRFLRQSDELLEQHQPAIDRLIAEKA